ncbi:MAG: hypothetical protein H0U71_02025 [Gammaproteobacteria bacterium]|nr:hypothetical protein [Gammaproteobacteria bacterium]
MIKWIITVVATVLMSGCGFHLRNQHALSPNLHCIQIDSPMPYADFESTLRRTLIRLGVNITRNPAPIVLHIISTAFYQDVPTIGGSNQARVYVYYYQVTFEVLNESHCVLIPQKCVLTSKSLIVNAGTALEATNQLAILQQEMQMEAAHMIINILNSPSLFCAATH